jgi:HTH-type transcriptional regulator/antitoxin HigA
MTQKNFDPDWISPTGDTIRDILTERGWNISDFSRKMEIDIKFAENIINGCQPIDIKTSCKLQNVLGGTVMFWVNREQNYRRQLYKTVYTDRD